MNYGSSLRILLTDRSGKRVFYDEPFTITKHVGNFRDALDVFTQNAEDALNSIIDDIELNERLKDVTTNNLMAALRARGYSCTEI